MAVYSKMNLQPGTPNSQLKILLIGDNPGDASLIREMLTEAKGGGFDLESADQLSTGLERLTEDAIDVVLLDLSLPDSQGLDTFAKVNAQAPHVPIIVLTSLDDEEVAVHALPGSVCTETFPPSSEMRSLPFFLPSQPASKNQQLSSYPGPRPWRL